MQVSVICCQAYVSTTQHRTWLKADDCILIALKSLRLAAKMSLMSSPFSHLTELLQGKPIVLVIQCRDAGLTTVSNSFAQSLKNLQTFTLNLSSNFGLFVETSILAHLEVALWHIHVPHVAAMQQLLTTHLPRLHLFSDKDPAVAFNFVT